jgi:hypothetical protein
VNKWRSRFQRGTTDLFDDLRPGTPLRDNAVGAIGFILEERLFSSCQVLCRHFRIGKAMCLWMLHNKLGLQKFHLRWVLQTLSINQKRERVSSSKLLLTALIEQNLSGFLRIKVLWLILQCGFISQLVREHILLR